MRMARMLSLMTGTRSPAAIGCIQAEFCRESLNLPSSAVHMETAFRTALSEAYGLWYNIHLLFL